MSTSSSFSRETPLDVRDALGSGTAGTPWTLLTLCSHLGMAVVIVPMLIATAVAVALVGPAGLLLSAGWVAGVAWQRLVGRCRRRNRGAEPTEFPAHTLLAAEVSRAVLDHRELSLLVVDHVVRPGATADETDRAERALARTLDGVARPLHVPVALGPSRTAIALPEHDMTLVNDLAEEIVQLLEGTRLRVGTGGHAPWLTDVLDVRVGASYLHADGRRAGELVRAATLGEPVAQTRPLDYPTEIAVIPARGGLAEVSAEGSR